MRKMSKLKNMKQTNEAKIAFSSPMLDLLQTVRTKEELSEIRGISTRAVRNEIAECSMYYAILATSDKKGYRLARKIEELNGEDLLNEYDEVDHAIHEISSRIKCLKKRLKPLIAYKKVAEKKIGETPITPNEEMRVENYENIK